MLEHATIHTAYTLPQFGLTFTQTKVYQEDGFAIVSGLASLLDGQPVCKDFGWFTIATVDIYNPFLDRDLCNLWAIEHLPFPVKNAVEEIAYQHRRIVSASAVWQSLQTWAIKCGVHPFNLPVNAKGKAV